MNLHGAVETGGEVTVPRGPVTSASTMIKSLLITNGVASLLIEDDGGA
jgi:hypothetical protein